MTIDREYADTPLSETELTEVRRLIEERRTLRRLGSWSKAIAIWIAAMAAAAAIIANSWGHLVNAAIKKSGG